MSTSKKRRVRLAVSIGCPSGIGPEVAVGAVARILPPGKPSRREQILLVGDGEVLRAAALAARVDPRRILVVREAAEAWASDNADAIFVLETHPPLRARDRRPGRPTPASGAAQLAWVDAATDLVTRGAADALVTGPVSKDIIARSGVRGAASFRGHTEHLARRLGAEEVTMAFYSRGLACSLVTTHLPLAKVPRAVTRDEVARAIVHTAQLTTALADEGRRDCLAVASLNPHAGENGLLGAEEIREITPGIALGRKRIARAKIACEVEGPIGAETAFRRTSLGWFSAVVAMYHDQATIPMKLQSFGDAVNVTLGLPIVRTSVDHGTGYDVAGKGTALPDGMVEAMKLATLLVARRAS